MLGVGQRVTAAWESLVAAKLPEVERGGDWGVEKSFVDEAGGVFAGGGVADFGADLAASSARGVGQT